MGEQLAVFYSIRSGNWWGQLHAYPLHMQTTRCLSRAYSRFFLTRIRVLSLQRRYRGFVRIVCAVENNFSTPPDHQRGQSLHHDRVVSLLFPHRIYRVLARAGDHHRDGHSEDEHDEFVAATRDRKAVLHVHRKEGDERNDNGILGRPVGEEPDDEEEAKDELTVGEDVDHDARKRDADTSEEAGNVLKTGVEYLVVTVPGEDNTECNAQYERCDVGKPGAAIVAQNFVQHNNSVIRIIPPHYTFPHKGNHPLLLGGLIGPAHLAGEPEEYCEDKDSRYGVKKHDIFHHEECCGRCRMDKSRDRASVLRGSQHAR